jgi:hypothetical protein
MMKRLEWVALQQESRLLTLERNWPILTLLYRGLV